MSLLKKKKKMAEGGSVYSAKQRRSQEKGVHQSMDSNGGKSYSSAAIELANKLHEKDPKKENFKAYPKQASRVALSELKSMPGPTSGKSGFYDGGMAEDCPDCCDGMPCEMHGEESDAHEMDMVGQVMGNRKMASGGEVESLAGFSPNEFDELELNPPPMDDSSAGNEHGDSTLFEDAVSKVMLRRRKQHNPSPA